MLYYFTYLFVILYAVYVTKRTLHMLQQNLYNENNRYLKWVNKNFKLTIFNYSLLLIPISVLIHFTNLTSVLLIAMMFACIVAYYKENRIQANNHHTKPLVYPSRIKRLMITI